MGSPGRSAKRVPHCNILESRERMARTQRLPNERPPGPPRNGDRPDDTGVPPMEGDLRQVSGSTAQADSTAPAAGSTGVGKLTIVMNAPEKIGKYRITGVIGEGPSGVVYKAFDPSLQRVVAVKSLHLNLPPDARAAREFAGRLGEQAQAISRINHPGIVAIHQVDEADGRAFVAMEHVAGLNLAQWLSVTPLPP